jgi:hypothetical protein
MYKLTKIIKFRDKAPVAERNALIENLRSLSKPGAQIKRVLLEPVSTDGMTVNGGDFIWHIQADDRKSMQDWYRGVEATVANPIIEYMESAGYEGVPDGSARGEIRRPDLTSGIYRTLILRIDDHATPQQLAAFEADMRAMPVYIDSIKNWQFTRVSESSGTRKWTHVWEQDYADIEGLMGPYVMHPHHWAQVDRWYQPDSPDKIVNAFLCHTYCDFNNGSVLNPKAA